MHFAGWQCAPTARSRATRSSRAGRTLKTPPVKVPSSARKVKLHIVVAVGDSLEHGLEADTEEQHGEGTTLLDAFEALEARDGGAIRSEYRPVSPCERSEL